MRSARITLIVAVVGSFVAGAFVSSPELRAYAADTVGSADIINNSILSADIKDGEVKTVDLGGNSVTAAKIKDGEVKAAEIATDAVGADEIVKDAVGASELKGVDKLIFADCNIPAQQGDVAPGSFYGILCPVTGTDPEDDVIVMDNTFDCFGVKEAAIRSSFPGSVFVELINGCEFAESVPAHRFSIIVYDQLPDKVLQ